MTMKWFDPRRFLSDARYRENEALQALGQMLKNIGGGVAQEGRDSLRALGYILAAADGRALTPEERKAVITQLQDLARIIPALAVFLLPGGLLYLPLLQRILPFDMRPTAFRWKEKNAPKGPLPDPVLDTQPPPSEPGKMPGEMQSQDS